MLGRQNHSTIESINEYIDLHYLTKDKCINVLKQILEDLQNSLNSGQVKCNCTDTDHVFQVLVGAGKHSNRKAVNKYAVN